MDKQAFSPGFRCSTFDLVVLGLGAMVWVVIPTITDSTGSIGSVSTVGAALMLSVPVLAFFLFCNVFRVSRSLELLWAGYYVILAKLTIDSTIKDWRIAVAASTIGILIAIFLETRKPSYHGVGWERINPGLPEWWNTRRGIASQAEEA